MIDEAVTHLLGFGDERLSGDLLTLLSDRAEHDEGMFSILHAAEAIDDRTYVDVMLKRIEQIAAVSPRWASIVLMRILNNDSAREELAGQVGMASEQIRRTVREVCALIEQKAPKLSASARQISAATL